MTTNFDHTPYKTPGPKPETQDVFQFSAWIFPADISAEQSFIYRTGTYSEKCRPDIACTGLCLESVDADSDGIPLADTVSHFGQTSPSRFRSSCVGFIHRGVFQ